MQKKTTLGTYMDRKKAIMNELNDIFSKLKGNTIDKRQLFFQFVLKYGVSRNTFDDIIELFSDVKIIEFTSKEGGFPDLNIFKVL